MTYTPRPFTPDERHAVDLLHAERAGATTAPATPDPFPVAWLTRHRSEVEHHRLRYRRAVQRRVRSLDGLRAAAWELVDAGAALVALGRDPATPEWTYHPPPVDPATVDAFEDLDGAA